MKQRSPLAQALLSLFIPFYIWYWLYSTGKVFEARKVSAPRFLLLIGPLLTYLGFIILLFVGTLLPEDMQNILNIFAILVGIPLAIMIIVLPIMYYWQFSDAADKATRGKANKIACFVLYLIFSPISVYLIQDALNETA